jgi:hypothetical protein
MTNDGSSDSNLPVLGSSANRITRHIGERDGAPRFSDPVALKPLSDSSGFPRTGSISPLLVLLTPSRQNEEEQDTDETGHLGERAAQNCTPQRECPLTACRVRMPALLLGLQKILDGVKEEEVCPIDDLAEKAAFLVGKLF